VGAQTAGEGRWADGEGEEERRRGWRKRRAGLFYVGLDLLFCGGKWEQNHSRDIRPGDAKVQCTVLVEPLFGFRMCASQPLFEKNFGLQGSSTLARPEKKSNLSSLIIAVIQFSL
jgi:hypothetical protein